MADKVKIEPKIITIHEGRASFYRPEPAYRTDRFGKQVTTRPDGSKVKPRASMTWLIDPSSPQGQATIKEIKDEAMRQLDLFFGGRENWPKDNAVTGTKGIIKCFGNGNDLPKVYDGYKDMFFLKVSDTETPIIGARRGQHVMLLSDGAWHVVAPKGAPNAGQPTEEVIPADQVPYAGAYCRGRISLYVYNNESAGVNGNFRSIQFLRPGDAFGGGGKRSASEELETMAGDAVTSTVSEVDPWG